MPIDTSMEEEDAVENDLEFENQQTLATQSVCEFITQAISEATESDSESAIADKSFKLSSQRSSNRLTKRPRKDDSVDVIFKKSDDIKQDTPSIRSKTRRPWELWSVEDKNAFFEALCEYGKDFESIQSYIAQRSKKKGTTTNIIKNKDQVRHFYYRTWHKISKFLKISECVQKQTQELYGLINYAELRKKIGGCLNEKNRLKLNELVFSGVTTVKYKGKKVRIKTPVCRALKKLNNFSDSKEPDTEKLPKDVFVEFRPYTNAAWLQVQNLAQNPRIRTKVCLQKRLKPVIEYLQKRWRPNRSKRKEQVLNSLPNYNSDEFCDIQPVLRIKPARGIKIFPLSMSAIDTASSSDVCLEKYLELSHKSLCEDINKSTKIINADLKPLSDKLNDNDEVLLDEVNSISDHAGESCDIIDVPDFCQKEGKNVEENSYINVLTPPKSVPELELPIEQYTSEVQKSQSSLTFIKDSSTAQSVPSDNSSEEMDCGPLICASDSKSSAVFNDSQPKSIDDDINKESNVSNFNIEDNIVVSSSSEKDFPSEMAETDESLREKQELFKATDISETLDSIYWKTIQHGWTIEEAGFLTFGELYLLFGKPTTIILEYDFECPEINLKTAEGEAEGQNFKTSELSSVLDKVFEIAHTFFIDPKHKQLSGKLHGRSISSKSKLKICGLNDKEFKDFTSCQINIHQESNLAPKDTINNDNLSNTQSSIDCASSSSDKHVFVMPVGTAPRNIKHPDQNSLKEEIGKLLPCTRRGCRVRRKPLVVQRPLLPRDGMRSISGPRPMTVVHFVPPVSPLTTVIPPDSSRINNKISVPSAKNVNILPPGLPLDMHPIQVPVVKQLQSDNGQSVPLQRSSVTPSQEVVSPSSEEEQEIIKNPKTAVKDSVIDMQKESSPDQNPSPPSGVDLQSSTDLNALNLDLLAEQPQNIYESKENFTPLSQLPHPDTAAPLVSNESPSTSFLDEFSLATKSSMYDSSNLSSCLNANTVAPKECTSSGLPSHHSFRINSSEIQWFNGESTELSLNTFLSSMDTPTKAPVASNIVTENSNLDPSGRLAPVVDSQVRCLLDECSIDFITKFEDLADVINNSSSSDGKQT